MCEYCENLPKNDDEKDLVAKLSSPGFVLFGSYVDGYEVLKVNFCPMCGRDLRDGE